LWCGRTAVCLYGVCCYGTRLVQTSWKVTVVVLVLKVRRLESAALGMRAGRVLLRMSFRLFEPQYGSVVRPAQYSEVLDPPRRPAHRAPHA